VDRQRVDLDITAQGMVLGDESLLTALTKNLVDNALKFSVTGPVLVSVRESQESVILDVSDTGPGIPAEMRARVFEPFFRSPGARQRTPGHGIGLALVAHIAEAHFGTASLVDSAVGTHMRVVLPQWQSSARPQRVDRGA
jgi:signal transduction histidine kinase